jgi:hypothetical protein
MTLLPIFPTKRATVKTISDPSGALYVGKGKSRDRGDNKKCSHCKKRHFGGADRCFVKYPPLRDEFKRKMEERQKTEAKEDNKNKNDDTMQPTSGHGARTAQIGNWVNAETGEEVYSLMALTHPLSPPNTNSSLARPTIFPQTRK